MDKVREFRQRAVECRERAAKVASGEVKSHYEKMARIWEKLAEERLAFFVQHPEEDIEGEVAADANR